MPVVVALAPLGALPLATRHDDHDEGAQKHLASVWLAPDGAVVRHGGP